jgi:uncharacterized protein
MGLEFFKKITDKQKEYGKSGKVVANGLQTNATLIDDEFAEHLAAHNFLLGVSLDGPAAIHDQFRLNAGGKGSHAAVIKGIESLKRKNVEFNILTLVSASNVKKSKEVFLYLAEEGHFYQQYIPCVEFSTKGTLMPYAITGDEWGDFLCGIYDVWMNYGHRKVSVRLFDSILYLLVDNNVNVCHFGRNCCQYFVVEYNGDIFPCDFFVDSKLKIGNVMTDSWESMLNSRIYRNFGAKKSQWNKICDRCAYVTICAGDCLKHRIYNGNIPQNLSWLCSGWKKFYKHALPGLQKIADDIRRERVITQQAKAKQQQIGLVGRNGPCPCGSGKKYKKCCGQLEKYPPEHRENPD